MRTSRILKAAIGEQKTQLGRRQAVYARSLNLFVEGSIPSGLATFSGIERPLTSGLTPIASGVRFGPAKNSIQPGSHIFTKRLRDVCYRNLPCRAE